MTDPCLKLKTHGSSSHPCLEGITSELPVSHSVTSSSPITPGMLNNGTPQGKPPIELHLSWCSRSWWWFPPQSPETGQAHNSSEPFTGSTLRTTQFLLRPTSKRAPAATNLNPRKARCDRRARQKLQLGFPAGSSVRNTPPTEVIATVTSLAELTGSWLMPMCPLPKSTKP